MGQLSAFSSTVNCRNTQLSKARENITFVEKMSVRPQDITQAIFDTGPQIVHFAGHGLKTGELCFEDQNGQVKVIEPEALASLFELLANQIKCVLLNACYSDIQAAAIAKHIDYVIGMNQAIGDQAAINFAVGFYKALAAGYQIDKAFNFGIVELKLLGIPEHLTPILIRKPKEMLPHQVLGN